jgi:hypothetical protein
MSVNFFDFWGGKRAGEHGGMRWFWVSTPFPLAFFLYHKYGIQLLSRRPSRTRIPQLCKSATNLT